MMKMHGVGRFTKDPELKQLENTCVCEFSLAVNEYRKNKKTGEKTRIAHFFDFQIWDRAAELVCDYCEQGDLIHIVEATPRQDKWKDKTTGDNRQKIIFRVDNFELLNNRKKEEGENY
jgi:single-strand DNA-binding protein